MYKPSCELGYTEEDLSTILTDPEKEDFYRWMRGQTLALCDGRRYNHERREYEETGCGPHGMAYYESDVQRFILGLPIIDYLTG